MHFARGKVGHVFVASAPRIRVSPHVGFSPAIRTTSSVTALGVIGRPRRPASTAIVLLGDQTPVPAENRVRRDDACHLTQDPPAECLAAHREAPALGVGQTKQSRTKMRPEDAILLPEIVDEIFLVAIHPASQSQHEEVQSVGHGRRLHGLDAAVTHVVSRIHSPRPFSRTIRPRNVVPYSCTTASQDWRAQFGSAPQGPYRVSRGFRVRAADDAADRVGLDP